MAAASIVRWRLITFDVTNTLLRFRGSRAMKYGEIGALFGVLCDDNALTKNFKANWVNMNKSYPNFGRNSNIDWTQWWHYLIQNTFAESGVAVPEEKLTDFANHLIELYKTSSCWQHCNGSVDLLNFLQKQQQSADQLPFVMGVISNFDPRLDTLLRNMKVRNFFEFVLNSYESGVEKPDAKIYELAMEASKLNDLSPSECLHIGDGPVTDYLAARENGWNAVLVHEHNAKYLISKYGDGINENHVFSSLYDFHKKLLNDAIKW